MTLDEANQRHISYCRVVSGLIGQGLALGVFVLFLWAGSAHAEQLIAPDHELLQYSGRIAGAKADMPLLSWPGTSIRARFNGTSLSLVMDDRQGKNWFSVFIDQDWQNPVLLEIKNGEHRYPVATGLDDEPHEVLIYKRTEGWEGATRFKGLVLDDGATLLAPTSKPDRRIEFYGDSITSGMAADAGFYAGDSKISDKNSFYSYAAIAARELSAEYHLISLSGIGLIRSSFGFAMPEYYQQKLAVGKNKSQWDFSQFRPQVVVVNLGQNDSWNLQRLNPTPDEAAIVQAYYDFISELRGHHPDALIVMALGSMDAVAAGSPWPGYLESAVKRIRAESSDANADLVLFEFTGYRKHPRKEQQQANADRLVAQIRQHLDW